MTEDVVIRATGLGKSYTRYKSRVAMMLDRLQGTTKRGEHHWALRDVSFEVKRGEFFGVIGRNGAGKSTLLQLLAGVLQPTEGILEVKGKVLALLELGASFDPLSTGRENCRVQMALFGIPTNQMDAKMQAVEEFAEIGDAFDEPVKTYSSGMFVRVAFAVNTVLEPDVLLVDEALAVGDVFFQQKCHARLQELGRRGCTIIFVTHNSREAEELTVRACWLADGQVVLVDSSYRVVQSYLAQDLSSPASITPPPRALEPRAGSAVVSDGAAMLTVEMATLEGERCSVFPSGASLLLKTRFQVSRHVRGRVAAGFELRDARGWLVHARHLGQTSRATLVDVESGQVFAARFVIPLPLAPGAYTISIGFGELLDGNPFRLMFRSASNLSFVVQGPSTDMGGVEFHGAVGLESTVSLAVEGRP